MALARWLVHTLNEAARHLISMQTPQEFSNSGTLSLRATTSQPMPSNWPGQMYLAAGEGGGGGQTSPLLRARRPFGSKVIS